MSSSTPRTTADSLKAAANDLQLGSGTLSLIKSCNRLGKLDENRAKKLCEQLAQLEVEWNYTNDCCMSRAHKTAEMMKAQGCEVKKYWIFSKGWPFEKEEDSLVPDPKIVNSFGIPVQWSFHVASMTTVTRNDGTEMPMIFDPTLGRCPLTPSEWEQIVTQGKKAGAYTEITDSIPYMQNTREGHTKDSKNWSWWNPVTWWNALTSRYEEDPNFERTAEHLADHKREYQLQLENYYQKGGAQLLPHLGIKLYPPTNLPKK